MPERLASLPQMQEKIDALLDVYGPEAIAAYNTDGTTCVILSGRSMDSSSEFLAVIQISLSTFEVTVRELDIEPGDFTDILI